MWKDPIVEEVRKIREAHARKFNYDLQAIYKDLKKREKNKWKAVYFPSSQAKWKTQDRV